jgi:hypothetical protein
MDGRDLKVMQMALWPKAPITFFAADKLVGIQRKFLKAKISQGSSVKPWKMC